MTTICTSNLTSGFVDLATWDEIEKYLYGGPDATAYFVRETRKSNWFTQVPVVLSRAAGNAGFNQEWSVAISRAGDYLLHTWLRLTTPTVQLLPGNQFGVRGRLRWTRNFMHNIIRECCITFNDLVAARFDNFHLDFWAAFTVPAGKRTGYDNMIGMFDEMTGPHDSATPIESQTLNLPLPLFFTRDTGVSLPTVALPYNDMRITFNFRDWSELLILDDSNPPVPGVNPTKVPLVGTDIASEPTLSSGNVQVWANYVIASNEERKKMACGARDILIEQVQTAPMQTFNPNQNQSFDIRFSHAIKVLFFAAQNVTNKNEWSNYTTACPVVSGSTVDFNPSGSFDPISQTTLLYDSTQRLSNMGSDYFSLVNPWYHAPVIPTVTGLHSYSYSLDFFSLNPMGSTNYGKLTNVSIVPIASQGAIDGSTGNGGDGANFPQKYNFITTVINNNVIRISGGALGFPVL